MRILEEAGLLSRKKLGREHHCRLEQKRMTGSDREIVITRLIDAPLERVWRAWADPKEIVQGGAAIYCLGCD